MGDQKFYLSKEAPTNWIYVFLIIVLVFIVAGGILVYSKRVFGEIASLNQSPELLFAKEEIADWKTYRNEEYGFEVKYPKEWKEPESDSLSVPNVLYFGTSRTPFKEAIIISFESMLGKINIDLPPYQPPEGTEQWERIEVTIDNQRAFRYEREYATEFMRGVEGPFRYREVSVKMTRQGNLYSLELTGSVNSDLFKIFDQMLSTFRFLE